MVGLGLSILAGGLQGLGEGWRAEAERNAKAAKEVALATLNNQFAENIQKAQIGSNEKISAADIASREKLTDATLKQTASNEKAQRELQERVAKMELGSREKIASEGNAAALEVANRQIAGAKSLAEFEAASNQALNTRLVAVIKDGKQDYQMMTPDGKTVIPKLKDKNGKEYDWAGPDATTDAGKNYNMMIANGFNPKQAARLAFGATSKDRTTIETGLMQSVLSASPMLPNPDKMAIYEQMVSEAATGIIARGEAADAAADAAVPAAAAPGAAAAPASSTGEAALPTPMTDGRPDTSKMVSGKRYVSPAGGTGTWDASLQQMIPD